MILSKNVVGAKTPANPNFWRRTVVPFVCAVRSRLRNNPRTRFHSVYWIHSFKQILRGWHWRWLPDAVRTWLATDRLGRQVGPTVIHINLAYWLRSLSCVLKICVRECGATAIELRGTVRSATRTKGLERCGRCKLETFESPQLAPRYFGPKR
jgi:hypothetical protein